MAAAPRKFSIRRNPFIVAILDALLINGCIITTFSFRFSFSIPKRNIQAYHNTWPYITLIFLLLYYLQGLYEYDENDDGLSVVFKVFTAVSLGTVSVMALTFISRDFAFPRTVFLLSYFAMLFSFFVWRILVQQRFLASLPVRRVVLYGLRERIDKLEEYIKAEKTKRFELVAKVEYDNKDELKRVISEGAADCVIITDRIRAARSLAFEVFLSRSGVLVYLVPEVHDIAIGALHHTVLGDMPLICFSDKTILGRMLLLKRVMDIAVSFAALVILSPLLLLTIVAIKLSSRGPAIYSQERVGRGGRIFKVHKFRTMVVDAEKVTGPVISSGDDPRVTKIGRILRNTKIDELPQLINVLLGHMSLVGPRPERPAFVEEFETKYLAYADRKKVLPGLTGLAQISGLYESDPDMKLKYDLLYIYNYRPLMDIAIMYRTFEYVLRQNIFKR